MPARFTGANPALPKGAKAREQGGFTTEYSVEFRDEVNGYPAPGGNYAVIEVSAFAGRVTNYSGRSGITYNRPKEIISKTKAVEIAKAEFQRSAPQIKLKTSQMPRFNVNRTGYHTATARDGGDPAFSNTFFERKARLSYNVVGTFPGKSWPRECHFTVDAETGKLLSGAAYAK
ncbi:MAG: PepSY domain-containing protein [Fimbriimonadaceae bacterium]